MGQEAGLPGEGGISAASVDGGQVSCLSVGCQGDVGSLRYAPLLLVSWIAARLEGKYL